MKYYYRREEQQFGPMEWDELVATARAGSILPSDAIWTEGWTTWLWARDVPGLLGPGAPPPVMDGAPQFAPARSLGDDPMVRALIPVGRSPMAIVAGYLGLFAIWLVPAPLALIAGILAVRDLKAHPERHGMGRAVFAIIMGLLGTNVLAMVGLDL